MNRISVLLLAAMAMAGCENKKTEKEEIVPPLKLEVTNANLYVGDSIRIIKNATGVSFQSDDTFYATVKNGSVKAKHVGTTNITATKGNESDQCHVTVKGRYNLYDEPCIEWGITRTEILERYGNNYASSTESGLAYMLSATKILMFNFDSSNKLNSAAVMIPMSLSSTLAKYIDERYLYAGAGSGNVLTLHLNNVASKATTLIGINYYNSNYLMVIYMPYNKDDIHKQPVEQFKELLLDYDI